jgi:hypothetical protein
MNYKEGDRIIMIKNWSGGIVKKGMTGKVCQCIDDDDNNVGIYFDKNVGGHNCGGRCPIDHGWYIKTSYFRKVPCQLEFDFEE